jgi:hypothetical protein
MTGHVRITADEAHKLHETELHAWLIALRGHPFETLAHIPDTVLNFCRKMGYVSDYYELTEAGLCLITPCNQNG